MANFVRTVHQYDRDIFKIEGPLGKRIELKDSVGAIEQGQVLAFEETTGKLVKWDKEGIDGTDVVLTVAMSSAEAGSKTILVAVPGNKINIGMIKGADLKIDFKVISDLFRTGILLEEVR